MPRTAGSAMTSPKSYRTLSDELEELERIDPKVAEARRRFDELPGEFARYDRHMAARKVVGKRSSTRSER